MRQYKSFNKQEQILETKPVHEDDLAWDYDKIRERDQQIYNQFFEELKTTFSFIRDMFNKKLLKFETDCWAEKPEFIIESTKMLDKWINIPNRPDYNKEMNDLEYEDDSNDTKYDLKSTYFTIYMVPAENASLIDSESTKGGYSAYSVSGNIGEVTFVKNNLTLDQVMPYIADKIFEVEELLKP